MHRGQKAAAVGVTQVGAGPMEAHLQLIASSLTGPPGATAQPAAGVALSAAAGTLLWMAKGKVLSCVAL